MEQKKHYKYFTFLAMVYVTISLCSLVLAQRVSLIFGATTIGAALIYPLTFPVSDIMTEVYGFRLTRQAIWFSFFLQFVFAAFCLIITHLPHPESFYYNNSYEMVLGHLFRIAGGSLIGAIIGVFLNIYLISKTKVIFKGQYFWLRSLSSTVLGEFIYTLIGLSIMMYGNVTNLALVSMVVSSMLIKIIYNLITIIPTTLSVIFLKKAEQSDVYDQHTDFKILKISY